MPKVREELRARRRNLVIILVDLRDVQDSSAEFRIGIDKVGIKNVIKRIRLKKDSKSHDFSGRLSAYIDLPREKRGIHMSRNPESIEEVLSNFQFKKTTSFEMFVRMVSETLLEKHEYSTRSEVILEGTLILDSSQEFGGLYQKAIDIRVRAVSTRLKSKFNTKIFLQVSYLGMNACPCAQELIRDYSREILLKRADELNLTEPVINRILELIPLATHSQRGKGMINIEEPEGYLIDINELVEVIESSMSARLSSDVLKRPEEGKLVRLAHFNTKFVEDSLRLMAFNLIKKFSYLPNDVHITLQVENMESIHAYDAVAVKQTTIRELKEELISASG
ncbi:MAG: GTP cyclohydrolase MptA [Candidatus Helarchaeales archaeon]